ncbi:HET-domain-containing protein [Mytilinidion resinicola]|uniref:HET-domain-containing protein n=1 Tax=Mytilinidion resinicola TaxID=574789 RepID=A0A6A6Y1G2_9PEZI|nr:HET-domain-containing protein [Mytilinidion resinicola]KAF2802651.1 HET-domain-containing protein [Mytilinidion resinicola]
MRLLQLNDAGEFSLVEYVGKSIPPYAILSHRWGADDEEVTFKDIVKGTGKSKAGYTKIQFCWKQAARNDLQHFWIDTCCIDKSSSAELSEAINSMFCWYQDAARCYVYLPDVSDSPPNEDGKSSQRWKPSFKKSKWFSRGWTLQELIAPASVEFFSKQGTRLGDKRSLEQSLHEITGIAIQALRGSPMSCFTADERMSWAARRETKREEDAAYSLLGIFNIHMPLIYGEGQKKAFIRLRKEIEERPAKPLPSSTVPFRRDDNFISRDSLDRVRQICARPAARAALVGLGGVGKSQIAIEYAYQVRDELQGGSPMTWVFWVHAGTQARFEEGYRRIAETTRIDGFDSPKVDVLRLVRNWLCDESNGRWVMIVDNADDSAIFFPPHYETQASGVSSPGQAAEPLSDFLPQSPNGSILITSRSRDVARRLTGRGDCLVERAPRMTISRYIDEVCRNDHDRARLLTKDVGDDRRDGRASNSIIATWQISFAHIRKAMPTAARLLSLMSLFDRQGIPESLLHNRYWRDDGAKADFEEDIHTLTSFSLVEMSADGHEFEMHRLVQFSTKKWLELYDELEEWKEAYVTLMDDSYPVGRHENWVVCQALFPHAQSVAACRPAGGRTVQAWASVLFKAAWYAGDMGKYKEAEEMDRALEGREKALGKEHPNTLTSVSNLALVLQYQGKYEQAEDMNRRALEGSEKALGKEHPDTLTSVYCLAYLLHQRQQYKDASPLYQRACAGYQEKLGPDHPTTQACMDHYSSLQRLWKLEALGSKSNVSIDVRGDSIHSLSTS